MQVDDSRGILLHPSDLLQQSPYIGSFHHHSLILRRSRSDRLEGDSRYPRMRNVRFQSPCQGVVRKVDPVFTGVARWVRAERCPVKEGSIGLIPKVDSTFGSEL